MLKDTIIIGTSPLMLIKAIYLARLGAQVTILDTEKSIGGVWKPRVHQGLNLDATCHALESFPRVYSVLEAYSSVKFHHPIYQPIRVNSKGQIRGHYNNRTLLLAIAWASKNVIINIAHFIAFKNPTLAKTKHLILADFNKIWVSLYRLLTGKKVKHPKGGCVKFMKGLVDKCHDFDVKFLQGTASLIEPDTNKTIKVTLAEKLQLTANQVYCSSSVLCSIKFPDGKKKTFHGATKKPQFYGLYEILTSSALSFSYITFDCTSNIKRISLMDSDDAKKYCQETKKSFISVQFEKDEPKKVKRLENIEESLKLIMGRNLVMEIAEVDYKKQAYFINSKYSFLSEKDSFQNFTVLDTIGCLSTSIFKNITTGSRI